MSVSRRSPVVVGNLSSYDNDHAIKKLLSRGNPCYAVVVMDGRVVLWEARVTV
jgi:hypothetical protein